MSFSETFEKKITSEKAEYWQYPRFFTRNIGETAVVSGSDAHHLYSVLRMRKGNYAVICDGEGKEMLCRIISCSDEAAELEILERRDSEGEPTVYVRLFQCLPKQDKMKTIVQKAVETGACEIIPVLSHNCVSRPDGRSAAKKREQWQAVAYEASKQCGRGIIPQVGGLLTFADAVKTHDSGTLGIIFYECGGEHLSDIVTDPGVKSIDVFIGSEGGFERGEIELARSAGIIPATLGTRILRCETAPVAAISVLMNLTGNM